jgi:hypothetical protein
MPSENKNYFMNSMKSLRKFKGIINLFHFTKYLVLPNSQYNYLTEPVQNRNNSVTNPIQSRSKAALKFGSLRMVDAKTKKFEGYCLNSSRSPPLLQSPI